MHMHVRKRGGAKSIQKTAPNTEAVPGGPGFCLVALRKVRRVSLEGACTLKIDTVLCVRTYAI